uniref:Uncharacterized protein n=1 Tax=Arundo donax TaxID=35708 RepID=A0A0A9E8Q2_ARUDO
MARFLNSQGSGSVGVSFPANPVICVTLILTLIKRQLFHWVKTLSINVKLHDPFLCSIKQILSYVQ